MGAPTSTGTASSSASGIKAAGGVSGGVSVLGLAKGGAQASGEISSSRSEQQTEARGRSGLQQVVKEIGGSEFVVLVDDFHYMPREVQAETAKALKEAVRLGVKICTAAVIHRGDDLVRANPELRGRVRAIDLKYWSPDDLKKIALSGFDLLNADVDDRIVHKLAMESAGSP